MANAVTLISWLDNLDVEIWVMLVIHLLASEMGGCPKLGGGGVALKLNGEGLNLSTNCYFQNTSLQLLPEQVVATYKIQILLL